MKRSVFTAFVVSAIAMTSPTALAAETVTFDTTPAGSAIVSETLISNQYQDFGVTFVGRYSDGSTASPVATNYAGGPEGPNYQGNYLGNAQTGVPFVFNPSFSFTPRFETLSILFATGADNLSLSHNDFSRVSRTTFSAYDANNTLLETFTVNDGNGWAIQTLGVDGIFRLDLSASTGNVGFDYFGIDNLAFEPGAAGVVPEPSTWAMMIGGFGVAGGALRRRRSVKAIVKLA